jgi:CHAT domain-containing protein
MGKAKTSQPHLLRLQIVLADNTPAPTSTQLEISQTNPFAATVMLVDSLDSTNNIQNPFQPLPVAVLERTRHLMSQSRVKTHSGDPKIPSEARELENLGRTLYDHLLPGEVGARFKHIWEQGEEIHLHLELSPLLQFVPWEYLANEEGFLADQEGLVISRGANLNTRQRNRLPDLTTPLTLPLRLLIVVSSPFDLESRNKLDADREVQLIRRGVQAQVDKGLVEIELEDIASIAQLRLTLDEFKPHLLHFTGHGFYDGDTRKADDPLRSGLLLEDGSAKGQRLKVGGREFAQILTGRPELRAVVLSACVSALPGSSEGIGGTAQEMVRAGVPVVIAMQDSIRDDSATLFAQHFYSQLASGIAPTVALNQARKYMAQVSDPSTQTRSSDWAMPVLVTARPELVAAQLFNFEAGTAAAKPRPQAIQNGPAIATLGQNSYFVGRQPEQRLIRRAMSGPDRKKLIIISGLGGFGKSTLAQRSLDRVATAFKLIHVISCKKSAGASQGTLDIELATLELAQSLDRIGYPELLKFLESNNQNNNNKEGVSDETKIQPLNVERLARMTAQQLNAARGLVVLDNVEDILIQVDSTSTTNTQSISEQPAAQSKSKTFRPYQPEVAEWLEALLMNIEQGQLLATSRYNFYFTRNDRFEESICRVGLDKLEEKEALRLLDTWPTLANLDYIDKLKLYRNGADNPQMLGWIAAQGNLTDGAMRLKALAEQHKRFSEEMLLRTLYDTLP